LDVGFGKNWKAHLTTVASGSRNSSSAGTITDTAASYSTSHYKNSVQYLEATTDGTLFDTPAGPVKAAFGGGYRTEAFQLNFPGRSGYTVGDRNVGYLYAEALAPIVSPSQSRPGLHELEVSVSGRTEHYSDFGTTSNPKIGIRYVPATGLTLRGTWGNSFKAPSFNQLYSTTFLYLYPSTTLGGQGNGTALKISGGNPDLKPEKATSWTLGADYNSRSSSPMKLSATYFGIDYSDSVVVPIPIA
jgi:outer membrane receptor protein involved in Fe transport